MRPRLVDWLLLTLALGAAATGLLTFLEGRPEGRWLFVVHGVIGLAIVLLLVWKLQRVWPRLVERRRWDGATPAALLALGSVLLVLISGVVWTTWQWPRGYPNGMNLHVALGLLLTFAVILHMLVRFKPLRKQDFASRRALLWGFVVVGSGALLYGGQQAVVQAATLPGAQRRFTGSREVASGEGLAYPVTMWMLDNPPPLDLAHFRLRVTGAVAEPQQFTVEELAAAPQQTVDAILDCTGAWFTQQRWQGVPVSWLLEVARPTARATSVSFISTTGYRWSVPVAEARTLILALNVGDQALDHGHGAPLRLVAPGRRGFQWVKWVTEVRLLDQPDYGQWGAIFSSGL
jgi:DMSO/TMAO reductase YedYZ molybdopterin-dependent catalytic subunit